MNEEAMVRIGPQRHKKKIDTSVLCFRNSVLSAVVEEKPGQAAEPAWAR